ncbi:MAG: hypothetical protein ACOY46_01825 [Bacillota bacterium]
MNRFIYSLFIGVVVGIIDIIPMLVQGLDWYSNASAFFHWVITSFIIFHININIVSWLKGLVIGEILGIPIIILVLQKEPVSALIIVGMSAVLGSLVGFAESRYYRKQF